MKIVLPVVRMSSRSFREWWVWGGLVGVGWLGWVVDDGRLWTYSTSIERPLPGATDPLIAMQWSTGAPSERLEVAGQAVAVRSAMHTSELADFLRKRREALQPEDVGLPRGPRRRTVGLRREEVAELAGMSTDYYSRLERGSGPKPSDQMAAAIACGLRLTLADRDHLFTLIGHQAPARDLRSEHVSPGLMRVLDRLEDTPAVIIGACGETLVQTALARALFGDQTRYSGLARATVFRWFTDPAARLLYLEADHELHSRYFVSQLRSAVTRLGPDSFAADVYENLSKLSPEFVSIWEDHEIGVQHVEQKRFRHPEVGRMDLHFQILLDPDQAHSLLVFTATPGTPSYDNLRLLSVIGDQHIDSMRPRST
jgi:transcriptional regulator with XRE-family HTH domain